MTAATAAATDFERNENESFRSNATGLEPQLAEDTLAIRLIGGDVRFCANLSGIEQHGVLLDQSLSVVRAARPGF